MGDEGCHHHRLAFPSGLGGDLNIAYAKALVGSNPTASFGRGRELKGISWRYVNYKEHLGGLHTWLVD